MSTSSFAFGTNATILDRPSPPPGWGGNGWPGQDKEPEESNLSKEINGSSASNANLVRCIQETYRDEDSKYMPIQNRSDNCFSLYNLDYELIGSNQDWQSKYRYPFMANTVDRYVSSLMAFIDKSENWFEMKCLAPEKQAHYNISREMMKKLTSGITQYNKNFRSVIKEGLRYGLLSGQMHIIAYYSTTGWDTSVTSTSQNPSGNDLPVGSFIPNSDPRTQGSRPFLPNRNRPKLILDVISSSDVRRDSSKIHRYTMWKSTISRGQLRKNARALGYDTDAVERACNKAGLPNVNDRTISKTIETGHPQQYFKNKEVNLVHFEGTLEDPFTGEILFEDSYCVVSGDEVLLSPIPIPHWDNSFSVVSGTYIKKPGSVFGKSPITDAIDLFQGRNDLVNQFNNYMFRVLNPPILVEMTRIDPNDPQIGQFGGGDISVEPGQIIRTVNPDGAKTEPVRFSQVGDIPPSAWQYLQFFNTTVQELTGADQDNMGMPRTRGRTTAQEAQSRNVSGSIWMADMFDDLEKFISSLLETIFLRTLQYFPDEDWKQFVNDCSADIVKPGDQSPPEVIESWKKDLEALANMDSKTRYEWLAGAYAFKVTVFSSLLQRQMRMEQMSYMFKFFEGNPHLQAAINMSEMARETVQTMGLDPEKFLNKVALPPPPLGNPDSPLQQASPSAAAEVVNVKEGKSGSPFPGGPVDNVPSQPPGLQ